jgi:hypothetical protein
MNNAKDWVISEIDKVADEGFDTIMALIRKARSGSGNSDDLPSKIFQIYPAPDDKSRQLSNCHVSITSWALDHLVDLFDRRKGETASRFYYSISKMPEAAPLRGSLFEMQVLRYLESFKTEKVFPIRPLANSYQTTWTYRGPIDRVDFRKSAVRSQIKEAIEQRHAQHLVPLARNFATVDSIIYDPNDPVLTCIQITMNACHPIVVSGLKDIQSWLELGTDSKDLRPAKKKPWRFLFVVPSTMASNFKLQTFQGDTNKGEWAGKVDQYVLGLEDTILFKTS